VQHARQQDVARGQRDRVVDRQIVRRRVHFASRRVVEDAAREAAGEVDVDVELLAAPVCVTE
jgi:hypothetical protein